ncbi:MAG: leucyl aminopeptidase, partial [Proteobacteria bacterium]|nr:leucyl aminopeptidase [Pseudomonadota bacterium]
MTRLTEFAFASTDPAAIDGAGGHVAVFVSPEGRMDACARRADRLSRGAVKRWIGSEAFAKAKPGSVTSFAYPAGLAAEALHVAVLPNRPDAILARKTGVALARAKGRAALRVCAGARTQTDALALGLALRDYNFDAHRTPAADETA